MRGGAGGLDPIGLPGGPRCAYASTMWQRLILALGIVIFGLTLVAWYLLSGFGCEMNTSGCKTVRLDWSPDALRLFLPTLALGAFLIARSLWKMRQARSARI